LKNLLGINADRETILFDKILSFKMYKEVDIDIPKRAIISNVLASREIFLNLKTNIRINVNKNKFGVRTE
jgi:hypothetical protein